MNNYDNKKELPALSHDSLPTEAPAQNFITVELGKKVNITFPKSTNEIKVADFINKIAPMPREERAFNVKIGDALTTALYSRGIMVPVCVRADVDINISYDEVMESDDFNDIIDIPPDDEK